jgi:hypothetical protein
MGQAPYPWRRLPGGPTYPDDIQDFWRRLWLKAVRER